MNIRKNLSLLFLAVMIASCGSSVKLRPGYEKLLKKTPSNQNMIDSNYVKTQARRYVINASSLQQRYKWAESILEFNQALKYDSSYAIHYAIARSYKELGMNENALEHIRITLNADSAFIPAMELAVEIYMSPQYGMDKALEIYEQIVEFEPTKKRKLTLARLCELAGRHDRAIEIYEEFTTDNDDELTLRRLADLYHVKGEHEKYIDVLSMLMNIVENKTDILDNLIHAYIKLSDYDGIFKTLDIVDTNIFGSDDTDDLFEIYSDVGNKILTDTNNISKEYSGKYIDRIDLRFRYDWRINLISAYLADKIDEEDKTDAFIENCLDAADEHPDIYLQISYLYFRREAFEDVIELLQSVEENFPKNYDFKFHLGVAFSSLERYDEAIAAFKKSWQIDNNKLESRAQLGMIYDRMKKYDLSDAEYEYVLEYDPFHAAVNNNYAYSLAVRGDNLEEALKMSEIAVKASPNNASYLDTYSWVLYKSEEYEEALKYILKALTCGEDSYDLYLHLGDIYAKLQKNDLAKESWQKGAELFPDSMELKERLKHK